MSTGNRQSSMVMDMEPMPNSDFIRDEEGDEDYDMGDLKKDTQNKDRLSEVINQLLLKNVRQLNNAENQP